MKDHTLKTALQAAENNDLESWVQDYLRSDGNNERLADILKNDRKIRYTLVELPLSDLKRIIGPEQGMKFTESESIWEERISILQQKIVQGEIFPPLIVTDLWEKGEISDGGHRREALLREGYEKYWVIYCLKNL